MEIITPGREPPLDRRRRVKFVRRRNRLIAGFHEKPQRAPDFAPQAQGLRLQPFDNIGVKIERDRPRAPASARRPLEFRLNLIFLAL